MPDKPVDSSAQPSASDLRNAIAEQTQGLEVGGPVSEVPETYEETEEIPAPEPEVAAEPSPESKGAEEGVSPEPESQPEAEKPAEVKPAAPVYKIKVDGKEEEVTLEQLLAFGQKGRHYEKRMAEVKEKERELETERSKVQQTATPLNPSQVNEAILESFARDPSNTLLTLVDFVVTQKETKKATERKADREFEDTQSSTNPLWSSIRDGYSRLRETGLDRQTAAVMAENDFLREQLVRTKDTALKEGERKATLKQKAQMPSGHSRQGKPTSLSDMEPSKMTRDQLKAALRRQAE